MAWDGAVLRTAGILEEGLTPDDVRQALEEPGSVARFDAESAPSDENRALMVSMSVLLLLVLRSRTWL